MTEIYVLAIMLVLAVGGLVGVLAARPAEEPAAVEPEPTRVYRRAGAVRFGHHRESMRR